MKYNVGKRSALHMGILGVFALAMALVMVQALNRLEREIEGGAGAAVVIPARGASASGVNPLR